MTKQPESQAKQGISKRSDFVVILIFILVGIAVWGNVINYQFVYDDEYFVEFNPSIRNWSHLPSYFTDMTTMAGKGYAEYFKIFRPIRNISYLIDFSIAGLDPSWYHLHNLLIHLLNSLIIILIIRKLIGGTIAPVFAGLLYFLHPVQSEVVAWVKCRDDLLAAFFILTLFYCWLIYRPQLLRPSRIIILLFLFLLACLSKIQVVVFPFILFSFELMTLFFKKTISFKQILAQIKKPKVQYIWILNGLLLFIGILSIIWRHLYLGQTHQANYLTGSFFTTMLTMIRVSWKYIMLLIFPHKQFIDYSWINPSHSLADWNIWFSLLILAFILIIILISRKTLPIFSFGLIWIALFLLPVSNIVPTMQYMAERFLYLPIIGFAIAAASLIHLMEKKHLAFGLVPSLLIITLLSIRSNHRVQIWKDNITLFERAVQDSPDNHFYPSYCLVKALIKTENYEKSLPFARKLYANGQSDSTLTNYQRAEYARHLGVALMETGKPDEGKEFLLEAIKLDSSYIFPYTDLGVFEGRNNRDSTALIWFNKAIQISETNANAHFNRGIALRRLGQLKEAEEAYRNAVLYHYQKSDAHKALAVILWAQGRIAETIPIYQEALKIDKEDTDARYWLQRAQEMVKNPPKISLE